MGNPRPAAAIYAHDPAVLFRIADIDVAIGTVKGKAVDCRLDYLRRQGKVKLGKVFH